MSNENESCHGPSRPTLLDNCKASSVAYFAFRKAYGGRAGRTRCRLNNPPHLARSAMKAQQCRAAAWVVWITDLLLQGRKRRPGFLPGPFFAGHGRLASLVEVRIFSGMRDASHPEVDISLPWTMK
jgi:hypothetical protein